MEDKQKSNKECQNLEELKDLYEEYEKKYKLPSFDELNKLFDIEEVDFETDFFLRKIRKTLSERILGYLRFLEIILNPSNAPMFFFKFIKKLEAKDKEQITNIYENLGRIELEIVKLDLEYKEETEAEFIKHITKTFQEIRKELLEKINKMTNNQENKIRESGTYFG